MHASFVFVCCTGRFLFYLMWKGCGSFSSLYCMYWRCIVLAQCTLSHARVVAKSGCVVTGVNLKILSPFATKFIWSSVNVLFVSCLPLNVLCFFLCECFFAFAHFIQDLFALINHFKIMVLSNKPEYFSTFYSSYLTILQILMLKDNLAI